MNSTGNRKYITKQEAFRKMMKFCAYQERCHQEVKRKLQQFYFKNNESEEIMAELIELGFLNEERFAKSFAGGKFRMKKWGRIKIEVTLKQKEISGYCIRKGLEEIDKHDYFNTLKDLLKKKEMTLKGLDDFERNGAIAEYLIGKGYESELVWEILKER